MTTHANDLEKIAQRARNHPAYLAHVFAEYQQYNKLDNDSLATWLGCNSDVLPKLALCLRPAPTSENFSDILKMIAENFGLDAGRLATLVRQVDILNTFSEETLSERISDTRLRAARDYESPSGEE